MISKYDELRRIIASNLLFRGITMAKSIVEASLKQYGWPDELIGNYTAVEKKQKEVIVANLFAVETTQTPISTIRNIRGGILLSAAVDASNKATVTMMTMFELHQEHFKKSIGTIKYAFRWGDSGDHNDVDLNPDESISDFAVIAMTDRLHGYLKTLVAEAVKAGS